MGFLAAAHASKRALSILSLDCSVPDRCTASTSLGCLLASWAAITHGLAKLVVMESDGETRHGLHMRLVRARRLLSLSSNGLWGSLPGGWGAPNAFPRLQILRLANNYFSGPLPGAWANPNAFPYMRGSRNGMCGPLPLEKNVPQH